MIFSHSWLQKYFKKPLPEIQVLADLLTMHMAEVEEIKGETLDVKILPDRGSYGYGHLYLAREIGALTDSQFIGPIVNYRSTSFSSTDSDSNKLPSSSVTIESSELVPVFSTRIFSNISNTQTPQWISDAIESVGQRSINPVVDITNFIMFDIGQPMHAFDLDKVKGNISIRYAKDGEKVTLLDGREIALDTTTLVIADEEGPLDIAGIKGGKKAEVTKDTTQIIMTAGNFNQTYIRKTSQKIGIKNDSTKRYENGVTKERVFEAQELARILFEEWNKAIVYGPLSVLGTSIEELINTEDNQIINLSASFVSDKIGVTYSSEQISACLQKIDISTKHDAESGNSIAVRVPIYRSDLRIKEDIVEEVGRLSGYHNIVGEVPHSDEPVPVLPSFHYSNIIRVVLIKSGFSEVYTHSLVDKGDIPLANPLSLDRSHMRNTIQENHIDVLRQNMSHIDILDSMHDIRIFEIGHVFEGHKESLSLSIGVAKRDGKKALAENTALLDQAFETIYSSLGDSLVGLDKTSIISTYQHVQVSPEGGKVPSMISVASLNFEKVLEYIAKNSTPMPPSIHLPSLIGIGASKMGEVVYKPSSPYPYITRDIAVFLPGPKGKSRDIYDAVASLHNPYIVSIKQFDEFEKPMRDESGAVIPDSIEKTSYAFRIVFQSTAETLTEEIVAQVMAEVTRVCAGLPGAEVR